MHRCPSTNSIRLLWFGLCVGLLVDAVVAAPTRGRPVAAVLEELRAAGLDVAYSSDLVPPNLTVPRDIAETEPIERARQALAPHGLTLRAVGAGRFVVTRTENPLDAPTPTATASAAITEALQEISVYGSRYAIEGRSLGGPQLLSPTDIQLIPGSHDDALRALRSLPGLATNASGRPYIRGSLTDDVLIRFDGVPLVDPFHLKNVQSLISAIDPAAVERIELFSGGFPVRYGTRSGGVMDVMPPSDVVGVENSVGVSVLAASVSSVGRSDRWPLQWLVTARRSTLDLLEPVEDGFGTPQFSDTVGRLRWAPDARGAWSVGWLVLDDRIALGDRNDEEFATARYRDEYVWLARERTFSDQLSSRTTAVLTSARREREGFLDNPEISVGQLSEKRGFESVEVLTDWVYERDERAIVQFGAALSATRADYNYSRSAQFGPAIATAFGRTLTDDLEFALSPRALTFGVYASRRQRWQQWEAEVGLRVDGQDYRPGRSTLQWSPRVNVRYDLSERARVYASVGRFVQAQRVDEWRSEEAQRSPDPAQRAVHSIVGLELLGGESTRLAVEVYSKRWTPTSPYFDSRLDPLSLLPDLAPDRLRVEPARSEATGLEVNARTTLNESTTAWATMTWSRVADDFGSRDVLRSWDQPVALTAGLAWKGSRATLSGLAGWHTGWPRTTFRVVQPASGQSSSLFLGERNGGRWGGYLSLDLRASWDQPLERGNLMTFVEVTNASNRRNDCCATLETSGSAGPIETEIDQWLPVIVNIGMTFRWRHDR